MACELVPAGSDCSLAALFMTFDVRSNFVSPLLFCLKAVSGTFSDTADSNAQPPFVSMCACCPWHLKGKEFNCDAKNS